VGGGHGHAHGPGAAASAGIRHRGRLTWAFVLTVSFFGVELVGAFLTRSLALLSDAGHMLTDVSGLGMALAAIHLASRGGGHPSRTFGLYRLEILAALANSLLLFGVAFYVLYEAFARFQDPHPVLGVPMLVIAAVGLGVNLVAFLLLRQGASESLNVRGAYLEVLSDAIGSVAVIVAAVVVQMTGWMRVDAVAGAAIGLFILPRTWNLAAQALRILVQAAPPHIDVDGLRDALQELPGVVDVHDLHVWTLTSDMEVASAHLMIASSADSHQILDAARSLLREQYGVSHATLQVEPEDHRGCDQLTW
jgi:cobalt-zinc-cadmium efflux system protein